ncbi:hypothetical protein CMI47_22550 [Candidatus Pacearchaeota archaeon]|nr:hypothetical protein [Candidatus Pacearchaeota archaeon]|tara:strand:+ start:758 stop:1192 length:435 start_codon:yes stop_codon:yes gene_type:complete
MPANSWKLVPGLNNVGSYQVSGKPFVSGSCVAHVSGSGIVVRFPAVTKWVQIEPRAGAQDPAGRQLRVAFSENGLHNKGPGYNFRVHPSSSLRGPLDLKVSELWFMSEDATIYEFDVVAGLTGIAIGSVETSEGPSWSGSSGVG